MNRIHTYISAPIFKSPHPATLRNVILIGSGYGDGINGDGTGDSFYFRINGEREGVFPMGEGLGMQSRHGVMFQ